ncbi:putative aconitate hydratase [Helianthus anomalus]
MARETITNIRTVNKLLNGEVGIKTLHIPIGENLFVYDVAMSYKEAGLDNIVLDGVEYANGSLGEGAAKVPKIEVLLG